MRTKDIEVGKEYAYHGSGRGQWHYAKRVRVEAVGEERTGHIWSGMASYKYTKRDDVRCVVLDSQTGEPNSEGIILVSGREIQKPWPEHAKAHAAYMEQRKQEQLRKDHQLACGRQVADILSRHGVEATLHRYRASIVVEFDELYNLLQVLKAAGLDKEE